MDNAERDRVARVTALARRVWENEGDAVAFLSAPHPLLNGHTPLEIARTESGEQQVERLLYKLEYSLPV